MTIYYVDVSPFGEKVLLPVFRAIGFQASRLNFEMREIKDDREELIGLRISQNTTDPSIMKSHFCDTTLDDY